MESHGKVMEFRFQGFVGTLLTGVWMKHFTKYCFCWCLPLKYAINYEKTLIGWLRRCLRVNINSLKIWYTINLFWCFHINCIEQCWECKRKLTCIMQIMLWADTFLMGPTYSLTFWSTQEDLMNKSLTKPWMCFQTATEVLISEHFLWVVTSRTCNIMQKMK